MICGFLQSQVLYLNRVSRRVMCAGIEHKSHGDLLSAHRKNRKILILEKKKETECRYLFGLNSFF